MAHLWMQTESKRWGYYTLSATAFSLETLPPSTLDATPSAAGDDSRGGVLLTRASQDEWVLMTGKARRAWVNGVPATLGIRVLDHQDRITIDGVGTTFLSTETLPCIESFPEDIGPRQCPRCRLAVEVGRPAVLCPGCAIWYHESEEFPCFTCTSTCVFCPQETALDTGFRWIPEAL